MQRWRAAGDQAARRYMREMGMTKEEIEALATQAEERCLRDAKFALGPGGGGISDVALIAALHNNKGDS
jgi:glycerol dehydrogenase-like iron-containing ADH family enzyme